MKKNFFIIALILSVLVAVVSCKPKPAPEPEPPTPNPWPAPGEGGTVPTSILPQAMADSVLNYFTVNTGENPPAFSGQFVSHPHMLLHSTFEDDTVTVFNDRYIAFFSNGEKVDYYGKQWDDEEGDYYQEGRRNLYIIGTGENFSCYYFSEGYPDGYYAKQSFIFSGKWNESYGGLKDFQVAVMLLVTSGNPHLAPAGSFRVLGDGDGLAQDTTWFADKAASFNETKMSDEDMFRMFRVK